MASRTRDSTRPYDERKFLHHVDRTNLRVLDVPAALAALDELTPEQLADVLWCDAAESRAS